MMVGLPEMFFDPTPTTMRRGACVVVATCLAIPFILPANVAINVRCFIWRTGLVPATIT